MPTPKDREELRRAVAGFNGRFFYDGERGDIGYIAKECDDKQCDCPPHKNSDGDQDCSISIGGAGGVDETVGEPAARMLNAIGPLLDQLDEVTRARDEACRLLEGTVNELAEHEDDPSMLDGHRELLASFRKAGT